MILSVLLLFIYAKADIPEPDIARLPLPTWAKYMVLGEPFLCQVLIMTHTCLWFFKALLLAVCGSMRVPWKHRRP